MFPIGLTSRARYSSKTFALFLVLAGLGWTLLPRIPERGVARPPAVNAPRPAASTRAGEAYGRLPLSFEANEGQTDPEVKFLARGDGYKLFLTGNGAVIQLRKTERGSRKEEGVTSASKFGVPRTRERDGESAKTVPQASVLRMSLVGANEHARVEAEGALAGKSNYLIGSDPSKWRTNVPHFSRVRYDEVYPGVGLVFYGNRRRLEYDFHVAPGADPNTIRLAFSGARQVRVEEESGDLLLSTPGGELRQHKPFIYQEAGGARREIAGRYVILQTPDTKRQTPDAGRRTPNSALPTPAPHADSFLVGFEVAEYDSSLPLVIDPVLSYSTHLGGSGSDVGDGVELDAFGNAYISGSTDSTDFPTASPLQAANAGNDDFFVTKLNAAGSALIYSTYIGGSGDESSPDIALDERGHLYLTGGTRSNNFPTVTPIQAALVGTQDAAVLKLNPEGSALLYSTYLGGTDAGFEAGFGIAVNRAGQAFVAGQTSAPADFPTAAPFQAANAGSFDGFVSKLNAAGSALLYSTYLGGSNFDRTFAVAVDLSGNAYVVGQTRSNNFPTASPLDATLQGTDDGFVTKFNATGSALLYSTYVGGSAIDATSVVKVDAAGNAYVNGDTTSNDFPVQNALQPTFGGGSNDVFAFKLNEAGSAFIYSTYLGGTGNDSSGGCAIDAAGNFYLTGSTDSTDFPVTNALQPALNGGDDIFLSKIDADGSAFAYSTYLGGSSFESGRDVVVDEFGNAYVGGETDSIDYPFTAGAFQTASGGSTDSFFMKVSEFGSCSVPSYAAAVGSPFATGDAPSAVAVGDFDLDGHADLAVTNQGTGDDISILPGNGDGTFGAAINVPLAAGANPAAITVADFNLDGFPDLATANSGASNTTVLLNDGSGASFASQDFTTGTNPLSIVAGDWDGDGDTDLAVANFDDDTFNTLKSDGTGVFPTITTFATGDGPRALAVADFNLDGHFDLAIAQQNGQTVPVSLNDGAATFPIAAGTATGGPPVSIAVADFNLDGFPDAVTANSTAQNVTVLLGNGGATFASANNFPVAGGSSVNAVAAGDFNQDNRPDVAVVNGSGVSVLLGNGAGALGTASVVGAVTGSPATLVSGDFDEDTRPDFASVNPTADSAPVLLSGCGLAAGSALVVNSANDVNDGSCDATHCSLREAINVSNALAGTDSISFNIAGAGPHTISPTTPLPAITDPVVIDGTTEPDFAVGAPVVELAGNLGAAGSGGLVISADGSTVRGLVINRFDDTGLILNSDGNTVTGNFIGTDTTGTLDLGNGAHGIYLNGSNSNQIGGATVAERNVISGNGGEGIRAEFASSNNIIRGNHIGTNAAGTAALGNTGHGVIFDASGAGATNNDIGGTSSSHRNVISGNGQHGIVLRNTVATGNRVRGNFIGTNAAGTGDLGNAANGIFLETAPSNTVGGASAGEGNVISGNGQHGVHVINAAASGNLVAGNFIGTDASGTADLGNTLDGVAVDAAPSTTIGGTTGTTRNVISGNDRNGVFINGNAATSNVVLGNLIGVSVAGTAALGNTNVGVLIGDAPSNTVGGSTAAARNVISANAGGVAIEFAGATGNVVRGNYIGTDSTGTVDLGNTSAGVRVSGPAGNSIIGGSAAGEGNLLSGNTDVGVRLDNSTGNTVQGNFIGTDAAGTSALANQRGVLVNNSSNNTVGGTLGGSGNRIAFNNNDGVLVLGGTGNALLKNVTFSNGTTAQHLGIDLGADDGVTANDAGDADTGANNLQNFPLLAAANPSNGGTTLTVTGTLNSTASTNFSVEFFSNAACDAAGNGEGRTFLGSINVTTDATGNAAINTILGTPAAIGEAVTATATGPTNNTSEFSPCVTVTSPTIFTVMNTNDSGAGSFRQALLDANATAGTQTIVFNIPGAGPHAIQPAAPLPVVNDPAVIDATTQPGFSTTPLVELDGTNAGATANGLSITAGGTTVRGLAINRFGAGGSSGGAGILLASGGGNVVENCFLGLTPAGVVAPNNFDGVSINGSNNNRVGGVAAQRNVISGNERNGVLVFNGSTGNQIEGNQIGTDASGSLPRPNGSNGVQFSGASSNAVGSLAGGRSNHIAFNGANGVSVQSGTGNTVHANRISSNAGLGINLGADGVTANDAGDGDTGPNNLQNFPFLTSATSNGVNTNIGVLFISTPNSAFTLNFYSSPTCDPSGNGEGETFIGTRAANTNNNGTDSSPASFPVGVVPGSFITATATDAAGNTSEFSPCQVVAGQTFSLSGTVLSPANVGIVGINLTLGGTQTATTTTGPSGNYTFNGLAQGGNFTVTPSETNFVFNPPSRAVNNLQADQTGLDFTGTIVNHTITGTIRDEGGQGIADVLVTLSGALSAITRTDQQGNFAFPSVPTNGSFTVTPEKEGFTFDPPRQVINGINSNVRFEAVGTPQPSPTPTPDPSDDFSGDVIDPDRWSFGILTNPPPAFDPRLGVFQSGGLLHVQPRANVHGPSFNGLVSVRALDFDASPFVSVEVVQPAQGEGAQTVFGLGTNGDNWFRFVVEDASPPTPRASAPNASTGPASSSKTKQAASASTAAPSAMPTPSPLNILFQIAIGGAKFSSDPTAFDPSQHRFWRFRHDAPASLVIFETSPDALVWREQFRAEIDRGQTALIAELSAGTTRPNQNPGEALFDNFLLTPSPRLRFTTSGAAASEAAGVVSVEVQRTGSAESPVSVNFATSDGTATAGSDYTATSGTLTFAAGETLKTINVPVNNDAAIEPDETIGVTLSNPVGGSLGPITTATLTILDDDRTSNPIDRSEFFVSQHYRDFLGRDPDEDGLEFWTNNIESCGAEAACRDLRRVDTSAAFFLSIEFQGTGYFVHRLYEASFDRAPAFAEYLPDLQAVRQGVIIGEPGATQLLAANKRAFATLFANRPDFRARYDHLNEMQYVDALFANAGVTPSEGERTALIAGLLTNRETRAGVLQQVIEDEQFISREFNRAFVRMQYFGYLRRDPDPPGFAFWLKKLEDNGGDFRAAEMVKAFITSFEYRQRFGQP